MDYKQLVFFDIECANCYNGNAKICSFGYCIADVDFTCSEKRDVVINPRARFNTRMSRLGDVKLAYTKEEFLAAPDFAGVYKLIKSVLEGEDKLIIGHAVQNDVNYLAAECDRYHLPRLRFSFIDAQQIEAALSASDNVSSLDKIASKLGIQFTLHKSDDDAYASMVYLAKLCEDSSLDAVMQECEIVMGRSGTKIQPTRCGLTERRIRDRKQAERDYVDRLINARPNKHANMLRGKRFCFYTELERGDHERTLALVARITGLGGRYFPSVRACNVFVAAPHDHCSRTRSAHSLKEQGRDLVIMTEDELLLMLSDAEKLSAMLSSKKKS